MVQFLELAKLSTEDKARLLRRAEKDIRDLFPLAQEVIDQVRERGDEALVEFARRFDAPNFQASMIRAAPEDFAAARSAVAPEVVEAIEKAHANIHKFHEEQLPEPMWFTQIQPGIMAGEKVTPVTSAALYVPRGKGAFPSVMLMLATPRGLLACRA
ncbi:MAG: histidinol dehydrogenase [Chloroflexi bacterium OLB15]|nr:MAG: histidinol dehydrogenase [Chloroflexi bacterium OLB15]